MALLNFCREASLPTNPLPGFLAGASIEVMPRTAAGIEDFRALLPAGTRVYIAHIDGTPINDMVATAQRLRAEGFEPMPHIPARLIPDRATLTDWIARYQGEAGVAQALLLAGGLKSAVGQYDNAMQLLNSGAFDGFTRLHVAGHPEGNRDIDPAGGERGVMEALIWKQEFSRRTDAQMAIVTQFCFDAEPIIAWADRIRAAGVDLAVHIGVAGPAKLQTLLKFAITCGVGPSLRTLQRRARDVTKLLTPFEPTEFLLTLATHKAAHPDFGIESVHFFPLGGIKTNTAWLAEQRKG
ncbi:5,10-methylenetetrahydrofolate reductase [Rhodobacter veldkampii DSM 11550]|uniref:5,10-methylenetetrahydrofolate reductase n=1 Tax=Phaeovulum veldkampii DSM 11550 TaxID=1185920 RepID=A0A2T4JHM6_9RHOB|nr:5,10-methylenetetrahydrofolate reductase [Phaeovulum veldkampii]MBK5946337.1 5,10-methylenetetrahydrofolate reductase [Phaeovulum veldkampii DSM 11550]NCU19623.1 methylenetetrahydrofolate reductase [Candidatus Falkowbacteria bacterium]PTE17409.1 5,10-methylenetetrahydrofolate reductase [Phaeovulum veldkampii DSM 11550]TDQ60375.1 methylenetetrahydrofolate reductase (NADPH) [Phaeovulum veldkampii DSM 11550]